MHFHQSKNRAFILLLLALYIPLTHYGQSLHSIRNISVSQLNKKINYTGKFKKAIQWTDKSGENIVVLSELKNFPDETYQSELDVLNAEIYTNHYIVDKNEPLQTWRSYDFIRGCNVDWELEFTHDIPRITDLNNNGVAEIWIMYRKICHGDVSPSEMKIIMYEGQKKFAMRGLDRILVSEKETDGGEYKFDAEFNNGPEIFREFAYQMWLNNLTEKPYRNQPSKK